MDDLRRNALADLLTHLAKRDAFHTLRTKEQLGYIVSMYGSKDLAAHSVQFVVQSNGHTAAHLAARVQAFVVKFVAGLKGAAAAAMLASAFSRVFPCVGRIDTLGAG